MMNKLLKYVPAACLVIAAAFFFFGWLLLKEGELDKQPGALLICGSVFVLSAIVSHQKCQ